MTDIPPIWFRYAGEGEFEPGSDRSKSDADRHYVIGELYRLLPHYGRSENSHRHQFASIYDAWATLPPDMLMLHPSAEHLRKWALIKSGWCNSHAFVMSDNAQAVHLAAELRGHDEFAVVQIKDNVVIKTTAKSQSKKAMSGDDFQKSKSDCLAVIAETLGTTPEALEKNTGKSGDGHR